MPRRERAAGALVGGADHALWRDRERVRRRARHALLDLVTAPFEGAEREACGEHNRKAGKPGHRGTRNWSTSHACRVTYSFSVSFNLVDACIALHQSLYLRMSVWTIAGHG